LALLQTLDIPYRSRQGIADCVATIARETTIHPVRQYLRDLVWDGQPRIGQWLTRYLRAEGDAGYLQAVGPCWLISAVARVMSPGSKVDHALILEAEQGTYKSTLAATLAVKP